jgi:hypothetical protein
MVRNLYVEQHFDYKFDDIDTFVKCGQSEFGYDALADSVDFRIIVVPADYHHSEFILDAEICSYRYDDGLFRCHNSEFVAV